MPSSRISRSTYDFCPMRLREDPLSSRKQGGQLLALLDSLPARALIRVFVTAARGRCRYGWCTH